MLSSCLSMKLAGHLGMALLCAAPFAVLFTRQTQVTFSVLAVSTSMLPDVDLVLPIPHHGIAHTVYFALAMSAVFGTIIAGGGGRYHDTVQRITDTPVPTSYWPLFKFAVAAFLVGILSSLRGHPHNVRYRPTYPAVPASMGVYIRNRYSPTSCRLGQLRDVSCRPTCERCSGPLSLSAERNRTEMTKAN